MKDYDPIDGEKKKLVAYFTQNWTNNIGNLFIDIGATISLLEAAKVRENKSFSVIPVGTLNLWKTYLYRMEKAQMLKPIWGPLKTLFPNLGNFIAQSTTQLSMAEIIKADYAVFSGWFFTPLHFKTFEKLFEKLKKKGVKIILYGVGGDSYSSSEVEYIQNRLKKIKPWLIITRDSIAFEKYGYLAEESFDGLDAAFYVNRLNFLKDIEIEHNPYAVLTFDKVENRKIEKKLEEELRERGIDVIKCSHKPYGRPSEKFVSESPFDYLLLYSRATEVHSDRVHACVVTLSFGNKCKLYSPDIRSALFSKVCEEDITKELSRPKDVSKLMKKQVEILSQSLQG
jgi:hypothetical protein